VLLKTISRDSEHVTNSQKQCQNFAEKCHTTRDGFRERGALGHLSFWGPTQVWPIWPFVWKAWNYAPLVCSALWKSLLWCRLWFHNCLRSSTEIKAFPTFV